MAAWAITWRADCAVGCVWLCGLVAGEVLFSLGANLGSIMVVEWRASPRVGKFGEIMPRAVQVSWLRNTLSASLVRYTICRDSEGVQT